MPLIDIPPDQTKEAGGILSYLWYPVCIETSVLRWLEKKQLDLNLKEFVGRILKRQVWRKACRLSIQDLARAQSKIDLAVLRTGTAKTTARPCKAAAD